MFYNKPLGNALHIILKLGNIPYGFNCQPIVTTWTLTRWRSMYYIVACDISEWHILHFSSWSILVLHLRGTILFNWLEWLVLCLCRLIVIYRMDLKSISIILGKNTHKTQLMACTTICALSLIITKRERLDWNFIQISVHPGANNYNCYQESLLMLRSL